MQTLFFYKDVGVVRELICCSFLLFLVGCQSLAVTTEIPYETEVMLPPYLAAMKYRDQIEKCWLNSEQFSKSDMSVEVFPISGIHDPQANWISLNIRPKLVDMAYSSSVFSIIIEETSTKTSDDPSYRSSTIRVRTYPNTASGYQYYWLDIKRWTEGDTNCSSSTLSQNNGANNASNEV